MDMQETQEDVYRYFDLFDFNNEDFLNGLENVFESYLDQLNNDKDERIHEIVTEISPEDKERLTLQAKTFYFSKETGNILNIEDYQEWKKSQNPEPGYSNDYQKVVELIMSGRENEIPDIKQIPDTVLEGQGSESKSSQRKKPWEIAKENEPKPDEDNEEQTNKEDTTDATVI